MKPILWIALLVGVSVASSEFRPARQVGTTCSAAGKTASDTSCCGNLFYNSPSPGLYQYYASDKELAGTCCRNGFTLDGSTFTLTQAELTANSPTGGCYCDDNAPECHSEATVERKEADNPECCGKLVIYYNYYYFYTESPQEQSGTCSRTNPIAGGQFVPVSSVSTLPGKCYCDASETSCFDATTTPEPTTTPGPDPCTVDKVPADNPACCGSVFDYRVYSYDAIYYLPTTQETSSTCCRTNALPLGQYVTTAQLIQLTGSPEATVGECYCNADEASCVTQPTTTPEITTTAEPTTTTTPEPTTTTTTPEPTTTTTTPEPTTTTTTPEPTTTTTTPEPTTTTTTPEPTTSTTPAPLCPAPPFALQGRVLGGAVTDPCTVDGVLQFGTASQEFCNGVYVYDPDGPLASPIPMVYIPTFCKTMLGSVAALSTESVSGTYETAQFSLATDTLMNQTLTDNIEAMLVKPGVLEANSCQQPACVYNPSTMSSAIDLQDCFITSFGSDALDASGLSSNSGSLNKVTVSLDPSCTTVYTAGAQCFTPSDPNVFSCQGDMGAPVYCSLNTGETVLYGLVDLTPTCGVDNYFSVLPITP